MRSQTSFVHVTLVWQLPDGVLTLTATTPRRGTSYDDSWSVSPSLALVSLTVVDESLPCLPSYVSEAEVDRSLLAPDTTYTFAYAIVMRAGESAWAGSGSLSLTVGPDGSLTAMAGLAAPALDA